MEIKHTSRPDGQPAAVQRLNNLAATNRKSTLRELLPTLDALQRQGVPYSEMAAALAMEGFALKAESVRKALIRWRKRQIDAPHASTAPTNPPPNHRSGAKPYSSPQTKPSVTPAITSKADLVRLRIDSDPIDLNELAELGRKK